jgi:concentrative nucleoside transporter, CNT family
MAEGNHSAIVQRGMVPNPDPVLGKRKEHDHDRLHDAFAGKGREDDVIYSIGAAAEKSILDPDPNADALHQRHYPERHADQPTISKGAGLGMEHDEEKGAGQTLDEDVTDPQRHTIARLYGRYRVFVHTFIWLFFTG